jgi:ankyrin repeat domain-containing protein 13
MYQFVRQQETEMEMEDEVDLVMASDIVAAQLSTKTITFTREKAGWIWKEDRAQKVGCFL